MSEHDQRLAEIADAVSELEDVILEMEDLSALVVALGTCSLPIQVAAIDAVGTAMVRADRQLRSQYDALYKMTRFGEAPGTGE